MGSKRLPIEVDLLVVGAGPMGVLTGLKGQKAGLRTLIIDQEPWIGGNWRTSSYEGATFEQGLHFIHHPARWNEALTEVNEEIPLSQPTTHPLIGTSDNWKPFTPDDLSFPTQSYVQAGVSLVQGGMTHWLNQLVQKYQLSVQLMRPLLSLQQEGDEVIAETSSGTIRAQEMVLTGSAHEWKNLVPTAVLNQHSNLAGYQPALVLQLHLKKTITDSQSVHILKSRMDHQERLFLGLFESNLDATRCEKGRQITTWMCFLDEEDFQDPALITRWRRAMKRMACQHFPGLEDLQLWERFLALPRAGGPAPSQGKTPKIPLGDKCQWNRIRFLNHCPPHSQSSAFWTTQQVMTLPSFTGVSRQELPSEGLR